MTLFILFVSIIAILFLVLNLLFAPHNPYAEKFSSFECGFHSFLGQNRSQFNVKFFIFGLVFLLFDLEITLVFPFAVSQSFNSLYGLIIVLIFLFIVTFGFMYELGKGALKIDSKQNIGGLKVNSTNISISYVEKKVRGTNNSNTLYSGGNVLKNVTTSTFYFNNIEVTKKFYSTKNEFSKDNLTDNSNIESGASSVCNNKASTPSSTPGKKFVLFLGRTVITMIGVIAVKSLFLSLYNKTYNLPELIDNIFSLSSGLIGVCYLAGRFINYLLDFTIFNIKIKDLLLVNPTFNLKRLWNLLLSCRSSFFKDKLPLGVNEELSQKKYAKVADILAITDNSQKPSNNQIDGSAGGQKRIIRSRLEIEEAKSEIRKNLKRKLGETDEEFEQRVKNKDFNTNKRSKANKTTIRSTEEKNKSLDIVRSILNRRWAESDEQFEKRVKERESYLWKKRDSNNLVDYTKCNRDPWEIVTNVNNLRKSHPRLAHENMQEWTERLTKVESEYNKKYKKNPDYIPNYLKEDTLAVPKLIKDSVRANDPWDGIEDRKKYMNRTYKDAARIYEKGDTNYEKNLPSSPK